MSNPGNHHKISYIEFASTHIERTKQFYAEVFGWTFRTGVRLHQLAGQARRMAAAFTRPTAPRPASFAPLVVLYSTDLAATEAAIVAAGGNIVVPTFEFPGGRRFHFSDGVGNILAVWSE